MTALGVALPCAGRRDRSFTIDPVFSLTSKMPATPIPAKRISKNRRTGSGLAHWMERVVSECDNVRHDFAADPVHDLRVALRRCRSMADALMMVDPDKSWKRMKAAGRPLFRKLGELRDVQIMAEWVGRLGDPNDLVTQNLLAYTQVQERQLKTVCVTELQSFDLGEWKALAKRLPARSDRLAASGLVFQHLALEAWNHAHNLHRSALRNRSKTSMHSLRIGIKKLRYLTENFLPGLHAQWGDDLKLLQDALGEVHDLDVLWDTAIQQKVFTDAAARIRWRDRLREERRRHVDTYRDKMVGERSLWAVWRAALPQGEAVEAGALERLRIWASLLDQDFPHSRRVTVLALQLYDGLTRGLIEQNDARARRILHAAAITHNVGTSKHRKNHHKRTSRLIEKLQPPFGWSLEDLRITASVARYHRGALPSLDHRNFAQLTAEHQQLTRFLSGILRLVDVLDRHYDGSVRRVRLQADQGFYVLWAEIRELCPPPSEKVAAARYLLESACDKPILVRPRLLPAPVRRAPVSSPPRYA